MMYEETDCPFDDEACPYSEEGHYFGHGIFNVICGCDPVLCPFHREEEPESD